MTSQQNQSFLLPRQISKIIYNESPHIKITVNSVKHIMNHVQVFYMLFFLLDVQEDRLLIP